METLYRSAIKRIVASLRDEHCVDSKRGRAAEDGSDIGVVRDVFEHGYSSGVAAYFFYACSDGAPEGPERTAGEFKAGQLFELDREGE